VVISSYGVLRMNRSSSSPTPPTMWLRNVAGKFGVWPRGSHRLKNCCHNCSLRTSI